MLSCNGCNRQKSSEIKSSENPQEAKIVLEKEVERYLRKQVKERLGGMALKFVSPGMNGVPDRIILMPGARICFVETKAPGEKLRKLQRYVCGLIVNLGFPVYRIDTKAKVDAFIQEWEARV